MGTHLQSLKSNLQSRKYLYTAPINKKWPSSKLSKPKSPKLSPKSELDTPNWLPPTPLLEPNLSETTSSNDEKLSKKPDLTPLNTLRLPKLSVISSFLMPLSWLSLPESEVSIRSLPNLRRFCRSSDCDKLVKPSSSD